MTEKSLSREATAAIRGYIYQFDATISSILSLTRTGELTVEGVEDFDIMDGDLQSYFQCKYYAATRLTPATKRDIVLPMLRDFISRDKAFQKKCCYHIYGYFKDSTPCKQRITADELRGLLVRRESGGRASGKGTIRTVDMQVEIGATDSDLEAFAKSLTIHICSEYQEHKFGVIEALRNALQVSQVEAEEYLYPSAFSLVSALAATSKRSDRKIGKAEFIGKLRPSRALFNAWTLREAGESKFCQAIRKQFFSSRNIDSIHRLFVIELPAESTDTDLLHLVKTIRQKWSSHRVRRKPDAERYAPYIYFRSLTEDRLVALKKLLQKEDVRFVDGYAFCGAEFNSDQLSMPQTRGNQISLRFINSSIDFDKAILGLSGERTVYDFFVRTPVSNEISCHHVSVPITSIGMINNIV